MRQKQITTYLSRLMALLLCVLLLIPCIPVARAEGESGYCGQDLSWSLSAGTLTISGSGAMSNYDAPEETPWYGVREEISRLVLPSGMTTIGSHAFYGCSNLLTVTIPDSVTSVGTFAFMECTGMEYLSIGGSVSTIGEYAFYGCIRLQSLSLPGSLKTIGNRAFYRCESIPSVTIPSGVVSLGEAAFGRCASLVTADIQARITEVPEYLFYGCSRLASISLPPTVDSVNPYSFGECSQLSTVYYEDLKSTSGGNSGSTASTGSTGSTGSSVSTGNTGSTPTIVVPESTGGQSTPSVVGGSSPGYVQVTTSGTDSNGLETKSGSSVSESENVTISAKWEITGNDAKVDISATIRGTADWEGIQMYVESVMNEAGCTPTVNGSQDRANLSIYVSAGVTVDSGFLDTMNKLGVNVTVTAQNGSVSKPVTSTTTAAAVSYDPSYTIVAGTEALTREMNAVYSFSLRFSASVDQPVSVQINLGKNWAFQSATLFRRDGEKLVKLSSVMADGSGSVSFTLNSISQDAEYAIGMNLPVSGPEEAPAIPAQMLNSGKIESYTPPVQYEITGRSSSWGMNLGQVMGILAAVMVGVVVLVGFLMYAWNKQRLKNGYVPQWDDDEEE